MILLLGTEPESLVHGLWNWLPQSALNTVAYLSLLDNMKRPVMLSCR
jgi:hypothetical protein